MKKIKTLFRLFTLRLFASIGSAVLLIIFTLPIAYGSSQDDSPTIKEILDAKSAAKTPATTAPTPAPTTAPAPTQKPVAVQKPPVKMQGIKDKYDRSTPRRSFQGLMNALEDRDYVLALEYMDVRKLPRSLAAKSQQLSRELQIIFDRSLLIDVTELSDSPSGHEDDGLPRRQDHLISLETPDGIVDLFMRSIPDGNGGSIWKLANKSVAKIPLLYKHLGYGEIGDQLEKLFPNYSILGLEIWQWAMLLGIFILAFMIAWLITRIIILIFYNQKTDANIHAHRFIAGPVRFFILVIITRILFDTIAPSALAQAIFEAGTLLIIAIVWVLTGIVDLVFSRLQQRMKDSDNEQAVVLLRPATTLLKVVILFIALMSWLDNLGFSVTTLLAGLGVGGIAVGLAAQKSIENLIGAITMYVAQPVKIGDFCRAGTSLGVIEEIGLRSTMIRTLARTIVHIPNATFANMDIENLTKRDKILYKHNIRLRNDTTPDQVRTVLKNVHTLFNEHDSVDPDPARIRFIEYGESSLNLEAFAYIDTTDFNEYLAIVEDLNLRIMDIIEAAGTHLAVPAMAVHMSNEN